MLLEDPLTLHIQTSPSKNYLERQRENNHVTSFTWTWSSNDYKLQTHRLKTNHVTKHNTAKRDSKDNGQWKEILSRSDNLKSEGGPIEPDSMKCQLLPFYL